MEPGRTKGFKYTHVNVSGMSGGGREGNICDYVGIQEPNYRYDSCSLNERGIWVKFEKQTSSCRDILNATPLKCRATGPSHASAIDVRLFEFGVLWRISLQSTHVQRTLEIIKYLAPTCEVLTTSFKFKSSRARKKKEKKSLKVGNKLDAFLLTVRG